MHFLNIPGIEANSGLHLVAQQVETLVALLELYVLDFAQSVCCTEYMITGRTKNNLQK
jgi:hypothetical protein